MKYLEYAGFALFMFYISALAFMYVFQRHFMYRPQKQIYTPYKDLSPENMKPVSLKTSDGLTLTSWFAPPRQKTDGSFFPTVFYFHGNTGIVANAAHKMIPFAKAGFGVFMLEYRGYGGNEGTPCEKGFIEDAVAARSFVLNALGENAPLVYYGMSMGTGVANALAELFPPAALIQEAGFTTFYDAARERYPYFPVKYLMKDTFDTLRRIRSLNAPLLVLHGAADTTVPVAQAHRVYEAAKTNDKTLKIYPDARHINLYDSGASQDAVDWLKRVFNNDFI